ncbi:MAG: hypothetical protein K1X66_07355 [Verrucomicrobiae bacterium]|nr:hypothetical protein [Verrucomicrobiae bacterium]
MAKGRLTQILARIRGRSSKGSVVLTQAEVVALREAGKKQIGEAIRLRQMAEDAWTRASLVSEPQVTEVASEVGNLERLAVAAEKAVPDALWFAHHAERGVICIIDTTTAIRQANEFLLVDFARLLSEVQKGANKIEALKCLEQAYHQLGELTSKAYNQSKIVLDTAKKAAEKAAKIAAQSGASKAAKDANTMAQAALREAQKYVIALYEVERAVAKLGTSITDLTKLHELPENYKYLFETVMNARETGTSMKAAWEKVSIAAEGQANLAVQSTGALVALGQLMNTGPGDFMEKLQQGELPTPAEFGGAMNQAFGDPSTLLEVPCATMPGCMDMKREADTKVGEAIVGAYDYTVEAYNTIVGAGDQSVEVVRAATERARAVTAWELVAKTGQPTPPTQSLSNISPGL